MLSQLEQPIVWFDNLSPEMACRVLEEAGLELEPEQVGLETREERWLARLPGERIAWFATSEEGWRRLTVERRVLRLLEARCRFEAPRLLYEAKDQRFDLRSLVPGMAEPASVYKRLPMEPGLAARLGEAVGRILAEQHSRIGPADLAGWLPRQVAWPEPGEWIRERVPQVAADADLIKGIGETLDLYEQVAVDEADRVLAHTDVGLHNLALEPETLTVQGIFDFNDAAWTDRHYDFRYLFDFDRPELLAAARAAYEPAVGVSLSHSRIVLYNAVSAFSYLAHRLGTLPDERPCGRTLTEDLDWCRRVLAAVRDFRP